MLISEEELQQDEEKYGDVHYAKATIDDYYDTDSDDTDSDVEMTIPGGAAVLPAVVISNSETSAPEPLDKSKHTPGANI